MIKKIPERRFRRRQEMFVEMVRQAIKPGATWRLYLDFEEVHDDGRVDSRAVANSPMSTDSESLLRYCSQLIDQGFTVEVAVDESWNLHVVSWESREPTWPTELCPVFRLRWNAISDLAGYLRRRSRRYTLRGLKHAFAFNEANHLMFGHATFISP
ncbi:MAG: hypothetical protein R3C05_10135 [Pirellulaceae bacterium]